MPPKSSRRSSYRSAPRQKRRVFWESNRIAPQALAGSGQICSDLLAGVGDRFALRNATVIRMLLNIWARATTSTNNFYLEFQVGVVTLDAEAAGAVPEISDDWNPYLSHEMFGLDQAGLYQKKEFDIRTARKLRSPGHTLVLINTNGTINSIDLTASWRLLIAYG